MKKMIKISMVLAVAMLISVMAIATVSATADMKNEKTNTGITIDSKEKKIASYKITWNANGGKIGSKKTKVTTVKRGSKIGKLVASPKRSGYIFKNWYTKKSGGKKITKNTKPTKSVTYYAKWQKKSSTKVLTAEEKKFVGGTWGWKRGFHYQGITFNKDGSFYYQSKYTNGAETEVLGTYQVKKSKIYFTRPSAKDSKEQTVVICKYQWDGDNCLVLDKPPLDLSDTLATNFGGHFERK